ncbi:uncharacterized protein LOC114941216 isoform X1 [Nylanderia fulva]|nr:uncharacterized protein LOC114941216 isoform X1 [Nylanderia fulva]
MKQYKVFKFYINNGEGRRVQVVVWNDDITPVEPHVKLNHIIHLDGVQARTPKISRYNNGNVPYELQIQSNTTISNLGKYNMERTNLIEPELVEFCDVMNTSSRVALEGYIKSNFGPIYKTNLNKKIGCGSITDGYFKLEVHIINFDENDYELMKGDKIKVIGEMQYAIDPSYFSVQSLKDIKKLEERMSLTRIINVNRTLKKKKFEENSSQQVKIISSLKVISVIGVCVQGESKVCLKNLCILA